MNERNLGELLDNANMLACPCCNSFHIEGLNQARHAGAAVGLVAGSVAGVTGVVTGAEFGTLIGLIGGPVGATLGGMAGALIGGLFGGSAGCIAGAKLGEIVDYQVLKNYRCRDCYHIFRLHVVSANPPT